MWRWKFNIFSTFNGAKFKINVDLKEKITERYPGKFTSGFADVLSGGELLEPQWVLSVLVVLLI